MQTDDELPPGDDLQASEPELEMNHSAAHNVSTHTTGSEQADTLKGVIVNTPGT